MQKAFRLATGVGVVLYSLALVHASDPPTEAPAAFKSETNGSITQDEYDDVKGDFEEVETIESGLGPVYNAQSCAACHGNPITGGTSQVTELRSGHTLRDGTFVAAPGGSLINDLAIDAAMQERVPDAETTRTLRLSLNILGDGFIEAIDDQSIRDIAAQQATTTFGVIAGKVIEVPVAEAATATTRVGRFGWKNQQASLLSFAGDAYLNEMGITSRLNPTENTSMGNSVATYDHVPDPEDPQNIGEGSQDIDHFAAFIRATKAPPRNTALAGTPAAVAGATLFNQLGCNICHTPTFTTAPVGTVINGGTFTIPPALGNKIIHPFSDFLLHDVNTGDGIVQNGDPSTARMIRTTPLWGLRTHPRLMHDGASLTFLDAINRHGGEASGVMKKFSKLSQAERNQLVAFLGSL